MNYSEMSDLEINCEVLALMEPDVAHMQLSADQKSFYHCGYDGNGFYETAIPDYCKSWADAGPIIEENRIAIIPESDGTWFALGDPQIKNNWRVESTGAFHNETTPLRAAMIVFLMMQEAVNA